MSRSPRGSLLRNVVGDVGSALFAPLDYMEDDEPHEPQEPQEKRPSQHRRNKSKRVTVSITWQDDPDLIFHEQQHHLLPLNKSSLASLTAATVDDDGSFDSWYEPWPDDSTPRLLSDTFFYEIRNHLPEALKHAKWERCFAIERDGDSLLTFLNHCSHHRATLLILETTKSHVLGGFATEKWTTAIQRHYYGTGQSFLFSSHPECVPGIDNNDNDDCQTGGPHHDDDAQLLQFYRWSGVNDYCQICDLDRNRLAMGGDGDFGFVLQDNLERGTTGHCQTFCNPPLVQGGHFEIRALEVYGIVPLFTTPPPPGSTRSLRSSGVLWGDFGM